VGAKPLESAHIAFVIVPVKDTLIGNASLTGFHRLQGGNDDGRFVVGGEKEEDRAFADVGVHAAQIEHVGAGHQYNAIQPVG
jgi:hypothetical protein